jgi:hypothetical protein
MMGDNMTVGKLLEAVDKGEIVLPDFQRSFVWEPEDVRELLVSVLGNYFIGTMLILELYKDDSPFALRLFEGVEKINPGADIQSIVKIILDGQQRTTALFYALYEPDVPLKGRKSAYKFYLDLEKALNYDWDNAVIGVSVNDKRRLGEIKGKQLVIPFGILKNSEEIIKRFKNHSEFEKIYVLIKDFLDRPIHMIKLPRGTNLEKIVETFERINRTGQPLSVFELLTAKLYKYGIKLRDLLEDAKSKSEVLNLIKPELILKIVALIRGEEPKRKNILELAPENFENDWERAIKSLNEAYKRITDIKNGYGVFDISKWMPYTTMLVPLAVMLHFVDKEGIESPKSYEKIDKWYWISVFSNRYDQAVDTTSVSDVKSINDWLVDDSKIPEFVNNFSTKEIDINVDKQGSALYRGIMNLIVLSGALDFKTGKPPQFNKEKIQDDHIFPKSKYNVNSIINRTLITSNAAKGDKLPSVYFKERINEYGEDKLREILKTHLIPEDAINDLLTDNLEDFLNKRREVIVEQVQKRVKT